MVVFLGMGGGERTRPTFVPAPPGAIITKRAPTPRRPVLGVGPALGDEREFIHRKGSFLRKLAQRVVGGVPIVGGVASELIGAIPGVGGGAVVPGGSRGCPPGFQRDFRGGCSAVSGATILGGVIQDPRAVTRVPGLGGLFERLLPGGGHRP